MATALRTVFRFRLRPKQAIRSSKRNYPADYSARPEFFENPRHGASTLALWKKLSMLVGPVVAAAWYNAFAELEHDRPDFVPYAHLQKRLKPFPWGDGNHSILHIPYMNALPEGYEEDQPEHH